MYNVLYSHAHTFHTFHTFQIHFRNYSIQNRSFDIRLVKRIYASECVNMEMYKAWMQKRRKNMVTRKEENVHWAQRGIEENQDKCTISTSACNALNRQYRSYSVNKYNITTISPTICILNFLHNVLLTFVEWLMPIWRMNIQNIDGQNSFLIMIVMIITLKSRR